MTIITTTRIQLIVQLYRPIPEKQKVYEVPESYSYKALNLKNMLDLSMACSDSKIYTTWSNLKHSAIGSSKAMMTRHPSGNNNTTPNFLQSGATTGRRAATESRKSRSQSLPDLKRAAREIEHAEIPLNFSVSIRLCRFVVKKLYTYKLGK